MTRPPRLGRLIVPPPPPDPEKITMLVIDPSSSCTGYALYRRNGKLADAGLLTPRKRDDKANDRIMAMSLEMRKLIAEFTPAVVVIEDTSGKVARNRHGGGGAGLSIYGKAVGFMFAEALSTGVRVEMVLENVWTRGQKKAKRIELLANIRSYDPKQDPGGDMADAILLGRWWIANHVAERRGDKPMTLAEIFQVAGLF